MVLLTADTKKENAVTPCAIQNPGRLTPFPTPDSTPLLQQSVTITAPAANPCSPNRPRTAQQQLAVQILAHALDHVMSAHFAANPQSAVIDLGHPNLQAAAILARASREIILGARPTHPRAKTAAAAPRPRLRDHLRTLWALTVAALPATR